MCHANLDDQMYLDTILKVANAIIDSLENSVDNLFSILVEKHIAP
jgi:hypothetical protein